MILSGVAMSWVIFIDYFQCCPKEMNGSNPLFENRKYGDQLCYGSVEMAMG